MQLWLLSFILFLSIIEKKIFTGAKKGNKMKMSIIGIE
ncbi:hypothetical protein FTV88_0452 [Heliorestis convoluta]|uniref:Uncharacterized protein n=1 Tax=Heliorestis convoluta TaxID=356322 RepID=A0A5Q2MXQ5_9FIRM|nr:hypothetical protein FTV88_0452 [Heliorestis convoluta]